MFTRQWGSTKTQYGLWEVEDQVFVELWNLVLCYDVP